jgi:succinylglutamic semialdehyde dehydrogenase
MPVALEQSYIAGAFAEVPDPEGALEPRSPADLADGLGRFPYSVPAARAAVTAAREAQPGWVALPSAERFEALQRLKQRFLARAAEIARAISRAVGKPAWEAAQEAALLAAKIDLTLSEGAALVAPHRVSGIDAAWRYRPHGVMAVLGPFNFPLHLPNGHLIPALALGNSVVFKPSELTPSVGALYAQCVDEARLPPGVFNLVQGERSVGEFLSAEAQVDGVLFTGSTAVGTAIARANASRPGKLLALELGGKNAALVLEDADLEMAVRQVAFGAYATAGQRCSATSRCLVARSLLDRFADRLVHLTRRLRVGHFDDPVFMGPLISATARERFLSVCVEGRSRGAEPLLLPEVAQASREGHYVRPGVHLVRRRDADSSYQRDELFGPDIALYPVDSEEEAIALANDSRYGLCAAVFCADRARFEAIAARLRAGVIHWNGATVGASGRLPFGGVGDSGNLRPAGIFSSLYCAWPSAIAYGPIELPAEMPDWDA